jgi:hypothetical protein
MGWLKNALPYFHIRSWDIPIFRYSGLGRSLRGQIYIRVTNKLLYEGLIEGWKARSYLKCFKLDDRSSHKLLLALKPINSKTKHIDIRYLLWWLSYSSTELAASNIASKPSNEWRTKCLEVINVWFNGRQEFGNLPKRPVGYA